MHPVKNPEWHLHPRPAAFRVLSGSYRSTFSYFEIDREKRAYWSKEINPGDYYEMTNPKLGHFVDILTDETLSVSVIGDPYGNHDAKYESLKYSGPPIDFIELPPQRKKEIINKTIIFYKNSTNPQKTFRH